MNDASVAANRLSLDDINAADGCGYTLLLAEKCGPNFFGPNLFQARWNNAPPTTGVFSQEETLTYLVYRTPCRFGLKPGGINAGINVINNRDPGVVDTVPSSRHSGGGVVAAFCTSEVRVLQDNLDRAVYGQIISSSHAAAGWPTTGNSWDMTYNGWTAKYPISDADLK